MIEVIEAQKGELLNSFILFPFELYKNDPFYSPLLIKDQKIYFSHENPFFRHEKVRLYIALKDGRVSGRIVSIINYRHLSIHNDKAGFFGFFESINDPEVSEALLRRVADDLKEAGLEVMRGPMNLSTNEECGFLIEGFEEPPMLLTPYNPPYYNDLMKAGGLNKSKDLLAYITDVPSSLNQKVNRVAEIAEKRGVTVRKVNMDRLEDDLLSFKLIYNEAWKNNWGFIPFLDDEIRYMAHQLKSIIVPELMLIAEYKDEPVGFLGLIPDYNVVLRVMKGRLNPLTLLKALFAMRKVKSLRLLLLGIVPKFRNRGVDALLFREGFKEVKKRGFKKVEFSWILEDNLQVQRLVELTGARLYKKFRIYEKRI
jgi:GNAT superfamily N-acetyltransferase